MSFLVTPEGLWNFLEQNLSSLKGGSLLLVAEKKEYGVKILATANIDGVPKLIVEEDDEEIYSEELMGECDAKNTLERIYDQYMSSQAILNAIEKENDYDGSWTVDDEEPDDLSPEELEDMDIEAREEELDDAVACFLETVTGYPAPYFSAEETEDIKNHFLEYLARKWEHRDIYRPMRLVDCETGNLYFAENPYEEIIYEDDGNPIYKK